MNIEQAKAIPLALIFEKMRIPPTKPEHNKQIWYLAPWRAEKTASLHVHTGKNLWYDFGEGFGGSGIDLVCQYLKASGESSTVADALRWLRNMTVPLPTIANIASVEYAESESKLLLKDKHELKHPALESYLKKRGIPLSIGTRYLEELRIQNSETKKTFFACGLLNEEGGYELRNPFFKGNVGGKSISFIRGSVPKPEQIHLFEGSMDALSVLAQQPETAEHDVIVMNSVSLLKQVTPYLFDYGYKVAFTWFDNDRAGKGATLAMAEYLKTQAIMHKPMNSTYAAFKDVNAWHMNKLGLSE